MRRLIISAIILFLSMSCAVQAGSSREYVAPTLEYMVDFLFANGAINLTDNEQLAAYVRYKDCNLYQNYYNDDFAWDRIRNRIVAESKSLQKDITTHFVVKSTFVINRYNFKTKAFDLSDRSQIRNVNRINLISEAHLPCNVGLKDGAFRLPSKYNVIMDVPVSLYRLPMAETMGKKILSQMSLVEGSNLSERIIYGAVYITIDSVLGIAWSEAQFLGRVDRMEFYLDPERTEKIKTLYFSGT